MSRNFYYVSRILSENNTPDFNLPKRSTKHSAGYDFECIEDITIPPFTPGTKPTMVPTGIKCQMLEDEFLMLVSRSSNPKKKNLIIPQSLGIIDADYFENRDNEGEIFFAFLNIGNEPVTIEKGYKMGQGIFVKYGITENDNAEGIRNGGFGSTNTIEEPKKIMIKENVKMNLTLEEFNKQFSK